MGTGAKQKQKQSYFDNMLIKTNGYRGEYCCEADTFIHQIHYSPPRDCCKISV